MKLRERLTIAIALVAPMVHLPGVEAADLPTFAVTPAVAAPLFPLSTVRLLPSAFTRAVSANRQYLLALDPDRLLAPFRREAGLAPRKPSYGNWENIGLDGHTAGHYLSALSEMIASGADGDGELRRRLDYMIDELVECQNHASDGYLGGIPGSKPFWAAVAGGDVGAVRRKWAPWYNLHKTFAGLRDAYLVGNNLKARGVLLKYGDWAIGVTKSLSDAQMQQMLREEHGGMNEVLADIYAISGDKRYLEAAERFCHKAVLDPLERQEDRLNGLHANTQIPKVIGLERIAALTGNESAGQGARFFWTNVTTQRSVAFGGNSVSEHFNPPGNFQKMLEHREGPETCNTYNMLRLTEQLFAAKPDAAYADYYERALYNHILASINVDHAGYVYFTPIRPGHYRVYSQPGQGMWCCSGTGMENPGRYGQFIYAKSGDGVYVNLFIPSELSEPSFGLRLVQQTSFPDEARTRLTLKLDKPTSFTLHVRHPGWVAAGAFSVTVNGRPVTIDSKPSSYAAITREWKDGDQVDVLLPMRTMVEQLPDKSDWFAILYGPIVLASADGTADQTGLFAGAGRGDHIAGGPLWPLDKMPALLTTANDLPKHVVPDPEGGPLHFRLKDVAYPEAPSGVPLVPFFRLQESRYQMYWELTSREGIAARQERLAAQEKAKLARDAATVDFVAVGEQQSEKDHEFTGESVETGIFNGRRWRHGQSFQYSLNTRDQKQVVLSVTYSGGDTGRSFDVLVNGTRLATENLKAERPGEFVERTYPIPVDVLSAARDGKLTVRFTAPRYLAGGIFDLRVLRTDKAGPAVNPE